MGEDPRLSLRDLVNIDRGGQVPRPKSRNAGGGESGYGKITLSVFCKNVGIRILSMKP